MKMTQKNPCIQQEQELLATISQQLKSNTPQSHLEDADRNFLMSLLPHMKQIPDDDKLDAQSELLMVLKRYKPRPVQHSGYFTQSRPYPTPARQPTYIHQSASGYQATSPNQSTEASENPQSIESSNESFIEELYSM